MSRRNEYQDRMARPQGEGGQAPEANRTDTAQGAQDGYPCPRCGAKRDSYRYETVSHNKHRRYCKCCGFRWLVKVDAPAINS